MHPEGNICEIPGSQPDIFSHPIWSDFTAVEEALLGQLTAIAEDDTSVNVTRVWSILPQA